MSKSGRKVLFLDLGDSSNADAALALQRFFVVNHETVRLPRPWQTEHSLIKGDDAAARNYVAGFLRRTDSQRPIIVCSDHRVTAHALISLPKNSVRDLHLVV